MKLEEAISYWVSESGYRHIQNYLNKKIHGKSKYALINQIDSNADDDKLEDIVDILRNAMETSSTVEIYYRGDSGWEDHIREGFFSVTRDLKKAKEYGNLYEVFVNSNVPRLKFSAEGGEVLIHDGMYYKYIEKTIIISLPPKDHNFPMLGNLYIKQKNKNNSIKKRDLELILSNLWCFMHSDPDEFGLYPEEPCNSSISEEFSKKTIQERYALVKEKLETYEHKNALFTEVSLILNKSEKNIKNVFVGGRNNKTKKIKNRK